MACIRGFTKLSALLLLCALNGPAAEDDGLDDVDLDSDLEADLDDIDDIVDDKPEAPVDDFDLGLSEGDRKKRMTLCYAHTMTRIQGKRQEFDTMIKEVGDQNGMKPEQAVNTIVFSWMMSCYQNLDSLGVSHSTQSKLSDEQELELFAQTKVQQASKRQWGLLETTLVELDEQQKKMQQQGGAASPGANMGASSQTSYLYIFCVFGLIFGLGALAVLKLQSAAAGGKEKDSSGRAGRKAEKAERLLKKKR